MGCSSSIPFFGVNNCETFFTNCKDVVATVFTDTTDLFRDYQSLHRKAESDEEKILYILKMNNICYREKELKKLVKKIDKTPIVSLVPMLLVYFFENLPTPFLPHHYLDRFISSYYEDSKSDDNTKITDKKILIERIEFVKLQFFQNLFALSDNCHLILTNIINIWKVVMKASTVNSRVMKKQLAIVFLPIIFREYPNNDEVLFEVYNLMFDLLLNNWGNEKPINELLNEKENEIVRLKKELKLLSEDFDAYQKEIKERYAPKQLRLLYIYVFHSWRYVTKRRKLKVYIDYLKNQNVTLSSTVNIQHHTIRETMRKTEMMTKTRHTGSVLPPFYQNTCNINKTSHYNKNNNDIMRDNSLKTSFLRSDENMYPDSIRNTEKERKKRNTLGGLKKSIGKLDSDNLNTSSFYENSPALLHTLHSNPLLPNAINLNGDNNNINNSTINNINTTANMSMKRSTMNDTSIYIPMKVSQIMKESNKFDSNSNDEDFINNNNDIMNSPSTSSHLKQLQYNNSSDNNMNDEYENIPSSILHPPSSPSQSFNNSNNIITKRGIYTKKDNSNENSNNDDNNNVLPQISMIGNDNDNNGETRISDNFKSPKSENSSSSEANNKRMIKNMKILDNIEIGNENENGNGESTPTLVSEKKFSSNGSDMRRTINSVPQEPLIPISDNNFRNSLNENNSDSEFDVNIGNDDDTHF